MTHRAFFMINDNVMRLDVSMNDAFGMTEFQGLEDLKSVMTDVVRRELREKYFVLNVVDVFKDESWGFGLSDKVWWEENGVWKVLDE